MAQSIFQTHNGRSPVSQDFIWLGEYYDGTHLSEFNLDTKVENSFKNLKRDSLIRFGLLGHYMKLFFECDGIFNINGNSIELSLKVGEEEYPLTGVTNKLDVITYKDAESVLKIGGGTTKPIITKFTFGYKTSFSINGVNFNFKPLVCLPANKPTYFNFRLVADKDLDGDILIKRNGKIITQVPAKLTANVGGEVNWVVV